MSTDVKAEVTARPMGSDDLDRVATLFASERTTSHCSCMAFCSSRREFALGWFGGGNARRFAAMAARSPHPMGVLAFHADRVVGWCACGPRSRYAVTDAARELMRGREPQDDAATWFLPCLFVLRGYRGQGVTRTLARAVVDLARREGATAIEGWPVAASVGRSADAFVGREPVFADLGFSRVARPTPERVIMRLEL